MVDYFSYGFRGNIPWRLCSIPFGKYFEQQCVLQFEQLHLFRDLITLQPEMVVRFLNGNNRAYELIEGHAFMEDSEFLQYDPVYSVIVILVRSAVWLEFVLIQRPEARHRVTNDCKIEVTRDYLARDFKWCVVDDGVFYAHQVREIRFQCCTRILWNEPVDHFGLMNDYSWHV